MCHPHMSSPLWRGEQILLPMERCFRHSLQGDGHQAVKSNLYGQASLSQGDVFTEHEINIFAQRQVIAYSGDFSSRLEA